jgi:hypothetical protein
MTVTLLHGDCLEQMAAMADGCVDAIVTDPPAGISFMGRHWDGDKGGRDHWIAWMRSVAAEALRVAKPGAHALVWALPRTSHWTATAWENAGWEVRDRCSHIFGSGFPKSMSVDKAIDKALGAEREVIGQNVRAGGNMKGGNLIAGQARADSLELITAPATPEAQQWAGWGTALKPAMEDWWLLRKPLIGTVAQNVLAHGTGALNIGACRVNPGEFTKSGGRSVRGNGGVYGDGIAPTAFEPHNAGRWPANVITDGSDEVLEAFAAFGSSKSKSGGKAGATVLGVMNDDAWKPRETARGGHDDEGSPARFFYAAKASRAERNQSKHPTQKPLALMRYLCKLITPPGGTVLDMFAGSGTTLLAAQLEGFDAVGIEQDAAYVADARRRLGITFQLEAAD